LKIINVRKSLLTYVKSHILQGITDPSNINQYKSLSQLFDAIDPFITKEPSAVARTLDKFVELGEQLYLYVIENILYTHQKS
jgi:hypothetical protein